MMDISMGKDEKEMFIVNVKMNDDGEHFTVYYADGHSVMHEFTAHNYGVYIYRMKHQILDNRSIYKDTQKFVMTMAVVKEYKALLYSMVGLYLTMNVPIAAWLKIVVFILVVLYNLGYSLKQLYVICDAIVKLGKFHSLDEFVQIMERFRIDVTDPVTGYKEDWYLINIGDIEPGSDIDKIKNQSVNLTDAFKASESERISEMLKVKFAKRLAKVPKKVN